MTDLPSVRIRLAPLLAILLAFPLLACGTEPADEGVITPEAFLESPPENALLLDVRTPAEFAAGRVPGATNVSHTELPDRLAELPADKSQPIVVYCKSGKRAGMAMGMLAQAGYENVLHLEGDMDGWLAAGRTVEQN